ncbi:RapZ C-terminal domain-containing protein [Corynebacterium ulcerans]|uniref:RapZ C-terminal domain-containing protein n=1 Tax=Corynebacterium ulcerans TaxID=65058 RepID=UPI0002141BD8|nr:hypothetical protein [Corynebacterium ulcerans]AEG84418.1 hypothetical protein CULC22_01708 [Corynebacterium ulcerans BR-AD22]
MNISIYSCNEKMAAFVRGEMIYLDVRDLPDPSPIVQDLFGTDPRVWEAMVAEDEQLVMRKAITAAVWALTNKTLCVFCEGGWHRSVAIVEKAAEMLRRMDDSGFIKVDVIHMETKK